MDNIINAGIYKYSTKIEYDSERISNQLVYDYYRHPENLTPELKSSLLKYLGQPQPETFISKNGDIKTSTPSGFEKGTDGTIKFNPIAEYYTLKPAFEKNPDFYKAATIYYTVHQSMRSLEVTGKTGLCVREGRKIWDGVYEREECPCINMYLAYEYRDEEKSEFEVAQLAAFIAIRSILGTASSKKTNRNHILARMFGYGTIDKLNNRSKSNPQIERLISKYSKRYWMDKILLKLQLNWHILIDGSRCRGLYIGNESNVTMGKFMEITEGQREKNRIKELKRQKEEERQKALERINSRKYENSTKKVQQLK